MGILWKEANRRECSWRHSPGHRRPGQAGQASRARQAARRRRQPAAERGAAAADRRRRPAGEQSGRPDHAGSRGCCANCTAAWSLGRRFDTQATALTKQGRLAVYPSSRGQDACQVGAVLALRDQDWLFPTYRDSVAVLTRGVPADETLALLRGDWHCGYDPYEHRVAPQCTPLATNTLHAVGLAYAARLKEQDQVALVLLGDGATSEGDTHEALNFAGGMEGARGLPRAEQRLRDQRAAGQADRGADARRARASATASPRCSSTATTRPPSTRRSGRGVEPGRRRRRPDPDRGAHLPDRGAHQRRRRHPLPGQRRGAGLARPRPDHQAGRLPQGAGRARRRGRRRLAAEAERLAEDVRARR